MTVVKGFVEKTSILHVAGFLYLPLRCYKSVLKHIWLIPVKKCGNACVLVLAPGKYLKRLEKHPQWSKVLIKFQVSWYTTTIP